MLAEGVFKVSRRSGIHDGRHRDVGPHGCRRHAHGWLDCYQRWLPHLGEDGGYLISERLEPIF